MKFSELSLHEDVLKGLTEANYIDCQPIQEATIATALTGKDICAQAQTGSGKTAAFLVPIFQRFLSGELATPDKALVIAPTRELALQIEEEAILLGRHLSVTVGCFYGGVGYDKQEKMLKSNVNIVVGTPGRIIDHMQAGRLNFKEIKMAVIDEADRLFDMGFLPDLKKMFKQMRKPAERQTMLLSATLSTKVKHLAWEYMNDPAEFVVNPEKMTVDTITQEVYHVSTKEKMGLLLGILRDNPPKNAIIFTNTKQAAFEVAHRLRVNGFTAEYIIGDLPQSKRVRNIDMFKAGDVQFLAATDVAARGIHVRDLEMVFNYDIPEDPESYVHRIGRTARVGQSGRATSFACEKFVYGLEGVEKYIDMELTVVAVTDESFAPDKSAGRRFRLERKGDSRGRDGRTPHKGRQGKAPHRPGDRNGRPGEHRGGRRNPKAKPVAKRGSGGGHAGARAAQNEEREQLKDFLGEKPTPQKARSHRGGQVKSKNGDKREGYRPHAEGQPQKQGEGQPKRRRRRPPRRNTEHTSQKSTGKNTSPRVAVVKPTSQPQPAKKSLIKKIFGIFGKK